MTGSTLENTPGPSCMASSAARGVSLSSPTSRPYFVTSTDSPTRKVVIELATAPDDSAVVKRFEEPFTGSLTSFLVSPRLAADKDRLETAAQMTTRRLAWAREARGDWRVSPSRLIVQTHFWDPQRPELNLQEAEVLWLLGSTSSTSSQPNWGSTTSYCLNDRGKCRGGTRLLTISKLRTFTRSSQVIPCFIHMSFDHLTHLCYPQGLSARQRNGRGRPCRRDGGAMSM